MRREINFSPIVLTPELSCVILPFMQSLDRLPRMYVQREDASGVYTSRTLRTGSGSELVSAGIPLQPDRRLVVLSSFHPDEIARLRSSLRFDEVVIPDLPHLRSAFVVDFGGWDIVLTDLSTGRKRRHDVFNGTRNAEFTIGAALDGKIARIAFVTPEEYTFSV